MTVPLWVIETAEDFWSLAGEREPFPRDLRRPIAFALPLAVIALPELRLRQIDDWLQRRGMPCQLPQADRALRACLVAWRGQGLIFLDGTDPVAEQRFSLAHELAHFLRDYWQSRQRAVTRLGPGVLEVLNGDRSAGVTERIDALLTRVDLDLRLHLLERDPQQGIVDLAIRRAEQEADLLAWELLAPSELVGRELSDGAPDQRQAVLRERLLTMYGLPEAQAAHYAARLVPASPESSARLRRFGLVP